MTMHSQSRKETVRLKKSFLSPKHCVRIATWNVQTLNDDAKGVKLAREMDRYEIDVLGVAECRYSGSDRIRIEDKTVVYSGREDGRHHQGVALFCSKAAAACLTSWEPINERLLVASFRSNTAKLSIVMAYAPTELAEVQMKDSFYTQLQAVLDRIPSSHMTMLLGDMNAKVGQRISGDNSFVGTHGIGDRNDNGTRLVDLCQRNALVIGGTIFPHKNVHRGTWRSPDGHTVNQIDHICISRKHRTCLLDVRALRGADIGLTDHYLVRSKIRVKLRKIPQHKSNRKFDCEKLKQLVYQEEFKAAVNSKLQSEPPHTVEESWCEWKNAVHDAAINVLGYARGRREEWISERTWVLIQEKKELKKKMETSDNDLRRNFREKHRQKAAEVKRNTRRDKRQYYHLKADEAEEAATRRDQRSLFKLAKEIGGVQKVCRGILKDENGNKLTTEEQKKDRWKQHFDSVLNCDEPPVLNDWDSISVQETMIDTSPFSMDEILDARKSLKNGKCPGEDLIASEMVKVMEEDGLEALQQLFNDILENECVPSDWRRGIIVCVPKKGDLSQCSNWRGITLLSVPCKTLSQLILNRIRGFTETVLREQQAGFRQGRGCSDHIFVLRNIVEQCEEWQKSMVLNFVDFRKAFDCIHRASMWKILEVYGIPRKFINIIRSMYDGSESCVQVGQERTEWFAVNTGVRQGDVLSPLLFNILLDFIMRKIDVIDCGIEWTGGKRLRDLDYADDICLLARDIEEMQVMVDTIVTEGSKIGLTINTAKTEVMKIRTQDTRYVTIGGSNLKEVDGFTYLGSRICKDGDIRSEVNIRIGKASYAYDCLKNVWKEDRVSLQTKLKLFNAIVISVLLYGCETWKGLKEVEDRMRRFESNCLRRIMKIQWYDHVSEEELRRRTGQQSVVDKIKIARWKWYGHALQMANA